MSFKGDSSVSKTGFKSLSPGTFELQIQGVAAGQVILMDPKGLEFGTFHQSQMKSNFYCNL